MFAWRNLSNGNLLLALEWLAQRRTPTRREPAEATTSGDPAAPPAPSATR